MGGVAASGGYYIATPAHWIVAQAGSITGSIGVLMGKLVNSEMLRKLRFNAVSYLRGDNADLVAGGRPFSDAQRDLIRGSIERTYAQFIERVAESRGQTGEAIDAIGGGRVWTGEQALERGLVDELGNLETAIAKARELAKLPRGAPAVLAREKGKPIGVQVAERDPAAMLGYAREGIERLCRGTQCIMPFEWRVE